jgi:hypothetical protein
LPLKNLNAATIKMMRVTIAIRSICLGSCPWWLIFQRIIVSSQRTPNQCGSSVAVPGTAAMRVSLGSGAARSLRRVDAAPASKPPRQIPSRARRPCQRHVVDPGCTPRLAAQQPRQRHPPSVPQAETLDRLIGINRAGRQMPAVVTDQRRQSVPVNPDHCASGIARQALHSVGAVRTKR